MLCLRNWGAKYFSNENNESSMVLQHGSNNETNFTKQFKEMTQEKLVQNFNQFFCKKTWRIFLLWPFLYRRTDNESMAVFILQSHYLSVRTWANILQFVWLCVTCIKMGTRHIMRPHELSFEIRLERRTTQGSSSGRILCVLWPSL